jgi:HSP20 family protein
MDEQLALRKRISKRRETMLIQWSPRNGKSDLNRLFGWTAQLPETATWQPAVDVHEDENHFFLVADLPGVDEKDVGISVENNLLTIKGERKAPELKEAFAARRERAHGSFSRVFTLPALVDVQQVTAEMKAGVLTVTLPKRAEAKPRQIKVNVSQ